MRCSEQAPRIARAVSVWSYWHHGAVLGAFALLAIFEQEMGVAALLLSVLPCVIGVVFAGILGEAGKVTKRVREREHGIELAPELIEVSELFEVPEPPLAETEVAPV